jgi:hypothetical protein
MTKEIIPGYEESFLQVGGDSMVECQCSFFGDSSPRSVRPGTGPAAQSNCLYCQYQSSINYDKDSKFVGYGSWN